MIICPTKAIIEPYRLDARRCIFCLTIEYKGSIPESSHPLIGNRVGGCDDCQLICPWNKYAIAIGENDFAVRNGLDNSSLVELFSWSKEEFDTKLAGSPFCRIGYEQWFCNLAIGLGNASSFKNISNALKARYNDNLPLVREHAQWVLRQHEPKRGLF